MLVGFKIHEGKVSRGVVFIFPHSFVCVFIFSEAEWVTLLSCLCSENEVKTDVLKFNHWRSGRIQ